MKLKYELSITKIGNQIVAVPLSSTDQFDGVITINETMKDILELLSDDITEEELIKAIADKYENVSQNELETTIHEICVGLKNEGLLELN